VEALIDDLEYAISLFNWFGGYKCE
jgi:hypothetical protein